MKGTNKGATVEWFQFTSPDDGITVWRVNLNFMMSNWQCIFGDGCPGCFGVTSEHTFPDMGCCGKGAYVNSRKEAAMLQARVDLLTEEDLGPRALAYVRKRGWLWVIRESTDPDDPDTMEAKTKVRDGGCVFANRADDGDGKIGCAFVHLGNRLGQKDHIDNMPVVCWQLPIGIKNVFDEDDELVAREVVPWDADYWGGKDEDGTHNSWLKYWCIDTPDAYRSASPLYLRMERELRATIGEKSYELVRAHLESRDVSLIGPMPGNVVNEGRPLLPLLVGGRKPKRSPKS